MSTRDLIHREQPTTTHLRRLGDALVDAARTELWRRHETWQPLDYARCVREHWTPRADGRALVFALSDIAARAALIPPGCHLSTDAGEPSTEGWRLSFWSKGSIGDALVGVAIAVEPISVTEAVALSALAGKTGDSWMLDCLDEAIQVLEHYAASNREAAATSDRYRSVREKVDARLASVAG